MENNVHLPALKKFLIYSWFGSWVLGIIFFFVFKIIFTPEDYNPNLNYVFAVAGPILFGPTFIWTYIRAKKSNEQT